MWVGGRRNSEESHEMKNKAWYFIMVISIVLQENRAYILFKSRNFGSYYKINYHILFSGKK